MPADLFNERTVGRLSQGVKLSDDQRVIANWWLGELDAGAAIGQDGARASLLKRQTRMDNAEGIDKFGLLFLPICLAAIAIMCLFAVEHLELGAKLNVVRDIGGIVNGS